MEKTCQHCLRPFHYRPRSGTELDALRAKLLILDPTFVPIICEPCHASTMSVPVRTYEVPAFLRMAAA